MTQKVRMSMIGCGGMARHHLRHILRQTDTTEIVALCEPSPEALAATAETWTRNARGGPAKLFRRPRYAVWLTTTQSRETAHPGRVRDGLYVFRAAIALDCQSLVRH
jgi:predicted dehydrogenase